VRITIETIKVAIKTNGKIAQITNFLVHLQFQLLSWFAVVALLVNAFCC
jgi:hypothetical protein